MKTIYTIADLREAIKNLSDEDEFVIEIHEGERNENLYSPTFDIIDGLVNHEGQFISEFRLCI